MSLSVRNCLAGVCFVIVVTGKFDINRGIFSIWNQVECFNLNTRFVACLGY